ncbi:MAG: peptidoglycan editing factor PgeF [Altererythrobacter sp.]|nr:peptidoglycan editing factor PgeF [Altererythrobacter sp.]
MAEEAAFDVVRAASLDGVAHGFFGHKASAHQFGYGGEGDEAVIGGIRAAAADVILAGGALVAPHQVHSPDVIIVTEPWSDSATGRPEGDALVTATPGLVLGIVTADCAPVLFADVEAGVIGAAHAGWRGARGNEQGGVLENTLEAMVSLGASLERIAAAIGPTIAQASYEVDDPFRQQFTTDDARFFAQGDGEKWQFDLPAFIGSRLTQRGVAQIDDLALDTYTLENKYYSYRRATHHRQPNYGRQISMIALS